MLPLLLITITRTRLNAPTQPKVTKFNFITRSEQNIVCLNIPMNYIRGMQKFEGTQKVIGNYNNLRSFKLFLLIEQFLKAVFVVVGYQVDSLDGIWIIQFSLEWEEYITKFYGKHIVSIC